MNTLGVVSSLGVGKQIADTLDTTESARKLYAVLLALALDTVDHKQYAVVPSFVTFHSSLTLIAAVAGISRWTAWRSLARLKNLGAVDSRVQKGKLFDTIRNTGTVIQVKLVPGAGSAAKLSYQDMNHKYKDLNLLARAKRLSHQLMHHINQESNQHTKYLLLKQWTVKPYTRKNPVENYRVQAGIESLLMVPNSQGRKVAESVDRAAVALAQALQDKASTDFYRKLLWRLKRHTEANEGDEFHTVYLQANRVIKADIIEWPGLRSPASLLVSRLKKYRWYSEVMGPPSRKDDQTASA